MLITYQINHLLHGGAQKKNASSFDQKVKFSLAPDHNDSVKRLDSEGLETVDAAGIGIQMETIKQYLVQADSRSLLNEFNSVKTFLYNNCTEVRPCDGGFMEPSQTAQKCVDTHTML